MSAHLQAALGGVRCVRARQRLSARAALASASPVCSGPTSTACRAGAARRGALVSWRRPRRSSGGTLVLALDAALPFDYEAQARRRLEADRSAADKLVIGAQAYAAPRRRQLFTPRSIPRRRLTLRAPAPGILGFGNFGQFLAKRFVKQGHQASAALHRSRALPRSRLSCPLRPQVIATSRTDYSAAASAIGVTFYGDADDFVEEVRAPQHCSRALCLRTHALLQQPDVVIVCTSILSMESVLRAFPVQRLRRSTLVVDVLSVKVFPKNLFLATLPPSVDILCLHPMFGPESGKGAWTGLPLVYDRVRVPDDAVRAKRCANLLRAFEAEGCRMVEMSCEEHDKLAASSQFITHTVGRMLGGMQLPDTPINTKGYESLLSLVGNTSKDSFDLYYGLFMYNENATEELARMEAAFDAVKRQLFDQLHDVVRQRIFYVRLCCAVPLLAAHSRNRPRSRRRRAARAALERAPRMAPRAQRQRRRLAWGPGDCLRHECCSSWMKANHSASSSHGLVPR